MDQSPARQEAVNSGLREQIPGPDELPLLGSLREFSRDPLQFMLEMHRQYGEIVTYSIGPRRVIQVNHPEAVQRVLQDNHRAYSKRGFRYDFMELVLGDGLLLSEGETWLRQRRLMQPAFHHQQIEGYARQMVQLSSKAVENLLPAAESGAEIDVAEAMMRLTLAIVNQTLFSTDIDQSFGPQIEALSADLSLMIADVNYRYERPWYPLWAPTRRNQQYKAAAGRIDRIIYQIIAARRELLDENPSAAPPDLLTTLLQARDADTGEGMSNSQLRDEVITLFIAGHETTANALTWSWYLLANHPQVEQALHAELDRVLGNRLPTFADYPNLLYTRRVIEESLRLYPPAWLTNRVAEAEDVLCDHHIPQGAFILLSPYVVHRHPAFWSQPEAFRPERFHPEASRQRPKFAYLPFGGGPRLCIGRDFALVEAALILAIMAQKLRLQLVDGYRLRFAPTATLRPQGGMPMYIERRG